MKFACPAQARRPGTAFLAEIAGRTVALNENTNADRRPKSPNSQRVPRALMPWAALWAGALAPGAIQDARF